jgi:ribosome maturation factor RimP
VRSTLEITFEQIVDAIAHDGEFATVEIVQHSAKVRRGMTAFSITIDKEGGVDVATCERIAARINHGLEEFEEPYALEVESAGLERPLVKPRDYERFAGKQARVITTLMIGGAKTHRGTLVGLRGENVVLATANGELPLPIATIKSANLEYDPRVDFTRDKRERKTHG